jgi:Flp pilus assembly protein TadB
MSKLILLIVGAAWLAVLLPPILRARINNSPNMSVSAFRRNLSSLQNSNLRHSQAQLRGMSRELAPNQMRSRQASQFSHLTGPILRPQGTRSHQPVSGEFYARELVRQRRQHTVVGLTSATVISLFLAFTTGSIVLVYAFTLSLIALIGYCYWLVQLRVQRDSTRYMRQFRNRAA